MDSISQATLGAAIGEILLGKKIGNKGAILGAVIGTLPDLDVILLPFFNEIQRITIHRGYSHSLLVAIIVAFLMALLLKKIKWTRSLSHLRLWTVSFLGLTTHLLLDACTTYGTLLFLPFSNERVSWDIVSIVDPYYTVPLLVGLIWSLRFFRKRSNRSLPTYIGLLLSTLYLMVSVGIKNNVESQFKMALYEQDISYYKMLTVPVSFGKNDWFAVAKSDSGIYMLQFSEMKKGNQSFEYFPTNDHLLDPIDPDITERLKWFSQDFYSVSEYEGKIRLYNMQCDMQGIRYFGDYKAPTAFYFEIDPTTTRDQSVSIGMHPEN